MSKIAEGGYGCVYTRGPSECIVSGDNVIKIFEKDEDEKKEWNTSKILYKIDPRQECFAYTTHRCKSSYQEIRRLNVSGGECSLFASDREKQKPRYIHYLPNAGGTLYRYMKSNQLSFSQARQLLVKICECLDKLHRHGYIHNDIKHDNILINDRKKIHLIDFGLMMPFENYLSKKFIANMGFLKSGFWYPPEYRWVFETFPITSESKMNELIDTELSLASSSPVIKRYVYENTRGFVSAYFDAIENFTKRDCKKYGDRVDVYALGQMMSYLFMDNVNFRSNTEYNFFIDLIRGMIHPNYKKRLSLRHVLKVLKS
jgi:serine/threonine protein kinase